MSIGIIPYYMFVERDTGPKHYFELLLVRAYEVIKQAVSKVSGIVRTVMRPSVSCEPGKIQVVRILEDAMIGQSGLSKVITMESKRKLRNRIIN